MNQPGRSIDLNADLGEGCPWDVPLLARVSSSSIGCGVHAGGPEMILATLLAAKVRGVVVGAHPGFADREGFGRREFRLSTAETADLVLGQVEALARLAGPIDLPIRYLKPHGALYNQAQREEAIAAGLVDAAASLSLPILGLPGGCVEFLAARQDIRFIAEGFADRRYRPDGRLLARTEPGAILDDPREIEEQVLQLVDRGIATICIHGDDPRSVDLADQVRAVLDQAGITLMSFA